MTVEIIKSSEAAQELSAGLVKAKTILEESLEIIKKQNQSFNISKELVASINGGVKRISKAFAETLVLGKQLNTSLKEIAQSILVELYLKLLKDFITQVEQVLEQVSVMQQEKKLKILKNKVKN